MQSFRIREITGVSSLIFLGFLVSFFIALAQENTAATNESNDGIVTTQNRQDNLEQLPEVQRNRLEATQENRTDQAEIRQEFRTENIENRQNLRTERAGALSEVRQKRVLNLSANISNRMEAAIARLFTISERLSARIDKLAATGVDTKTATDKLNEANDFLTQARAQLTNIDNLVYNSTTSPNPGTDWTIVRTTYAEAGRLIRSAHQALRETISLLKIAVTNNSLGSSAAVAADNAASTATE